MQSYALCEIHSGEFKVKNAIALTATACIISFRAIDELQRKNYIHVPQCIPGIDKHFWKRRAEYFHCVFFIISTENGQWQASFTPEKSTDKSS